MALYANERAVHLQFAVAEKMRKQCESMASDRLVDKRLLAFERLQRATARGIVFAPRCVRDLCGFRAMAISVPS